MAPRLPELDVREAAAPVGRIVPSAYVSARAIVATDVIVGAGCRIHEFAAWLHRQGACGVLTDYDHVLIGPRKYGAACGALLSESASHVMRRPAYR